MPDYDVVIVGGGPAGLAAGIYLTRGQYNTLLVEKESLGGQITKVDWIENYPGFSKGIAGPQLAAEMLAQATSFGLQVDLGEVVDIELYSYSRCLKFADGRNISAKAVVIANGCKRIKLGVPGETEFENKGVFGCALCDGSEFVDKIVVVCGGGDSGLTEAMYMTKLASRVVLLEATECLTASAILQERARNNQKLEIRCNEKVTSILGTKHVEAIEIVNGESRKKDVIKADGILVDVGMKPNTDFLKNVVQLNSRGQIVVDEKMATSIPYVYAAGDVRSNSSGQVITGVNDGAVAAITIQKTLQQEG